MLQGEHSAILSSFIKLLRLSSCSLFCIFYEWPLRTGSTVTSLTTLESVDVQGVSGLRQMLWLSRRVLDLRSKGRWFKTHRRHWVVSMV